MQDLISKLNELNACEDAIDWLSKQQTPEQAWDNCERGDWLIWLVTKTVDDRKRLVATTCECVRLIWDLLPSVSKNTIEVAESWTRGEATLEEVEQAADAAYAAYATAYAAYATAYAAYATVYAADATAYAADATAYAADATACAADREDIQRKQADIVRKNYTFAEIWEASNE